MNFNISAMNFRLPVNKADLPGDLKVKVTALNSQKLTNVFDRKGKPLANKEEEWDSKFARYAGELRNLGKLEAESAGATLPAGKYYIDYVKEIRILEADIELQQKDLLVMIAEPVDKTEIEKAGVKAIKLVQNFEIRSAEKGVYAPPTGRQRAKS